MAETKNTIVEHFDNSVNLYTVFGVFNALALFSGSLEYSNRYKSLMTFLFLTIMMISWISIRTKLAYHPDNMIMSLYTVCFDMLIVILILYWHSTFSAYSVVSIFILGLFVYYFYLAESIQNKYFKIPSSGPGSKGSTVKVKVLTIGLLFSFIIYEIVDFLICFVDNRIILQ